MTKYTIRSALRNTVPNFDSGERLAQTYLKEILYSTKRNIKSLFEQYLLMEHSVVFDSSVFLALGEQYSKLT